VLLLLTGAGLAARLRGVAARLVGRLGCRLGARLVTTDLPDITARTGDGVTARLGIGLGDVAACLTEVTPGVGDGECRYRCLTAAALPAVDAGLDVLVGRIPLGPGLPRDP